MTIQMDSLWERWITLLNFYFYRITVRPDKHSIEHYHSDLVEMNAETSRVLDASQFLLSGEADVEFLCE